MDTYIREVMFESKNVCSIAYAYFSQNQWKDECERGKKESGMQEKLTKNTRIQ
jgi:hypothetical protein